ncbi:MAG: preprotein translocase subunit SecE [Caldimicrobium sp.]|jgi:preprotein translocase subunit SecE
MVKEITEKKVQAEESNFISKGLRFLKEVKLETKKIAWAPRKQTLLTSLMVIFLSMFIGAYLGILDIIYNFLISLLVK